MTKTVALRTSRKAVNVLINQLPETIRINGGSITSHIGALLFKKIREAYLTKSRGGTDETGANWTPLSENTVVYNRAKRTKAELNRPKRPSQALTKHQQQRWWSIYRSVLARSRGDKSRAAKTAWAVLKDEGAQTLKNKYRHAKVDILYNTGSLFESIRLETTNDEIVVKSNHEHAAKHHEGKGVPKRELWPSPDTWPESWWDELLEAAKQGALQVLISSFQRG